ncbi:MAG: hypothetical protein COW73_08180 [Nitrospirae bacterium CG18_big_fil_WC_8_21_14_2_50_70_55]|nr:hypothetical protein [Deltaproteobacteria bacterium]OIP65045.1 MAG: hypothetical protein AUK30_05380 [Nitrospirae bacterium CG2_30_70_394]PIQ04332.1 MAG: hypothetical protein COW73_08180 [Nitrospirae bacterium CG18_big_fil_WC_8_21_14_2_50_70_55]PIU79074.1 MAG: hypothetical protein COS73_05315 [Nitrospirae bacterium CG06_land_8_20_14_3_00_70_43]PIW82434.1 MAG: hypothetical protein COZ96_08630 [Nitrospirae bacterium CG_4_8_14_3_um_filter_70_85]PIX82115.1 MAG: hypothetical protein COZ33_12430 
MSRHPVLSTTATLAMALGLAASPASGGDLSGKITYKGTPPAASMLDTKSDPVCLKAHGTIPSEEVVVGAGGGLQNVFIYVKEGLAGQKFEPTANAATLDQQGCQYRPHVLGVMAGQKIDILNSDETLHNVHPVPKDNREWNLAMPFKGQKVTKKFSKPEIGIHVTCNVHGWMSNYICVVDNPFFAVSGNDGTFTIAGLPDGDYTLAAWHEKFGEKTAKVTVKGATATTFSFE